MISGIFGSKYTIKCPPGSTWSCWELTALPGTCRYRFEGWVLAGRERLRKDGVME